MSVVIQASINRSSIGAGNGTRRCIAGTITQPRWWIGYIVARNLSAVHHDLQDSECGGVGHLLGYKSHAIRRFPRCGWMVHIDAIDLGSIVTV